jgi:hypothetical protein
MLWRPEGTWREGSFIPKWLFSKHGLDFSTHVLHDPFSPLVAEFPDREPVILAGLATMDAEPPSNGRQIAGRAGKTHRHRNAGRSRG